MTEFSILGELLLKIQLHLFPWMAYPFLMLVTGHSPSITYSGMSGETLTNIGEVHPSGKQI